MPEPRRRSLALCLAAGVLLPAWSQVPPSPAELAAYTSLHAAAHRGLVTELEAALQRDPDGINRRDDHGRTPLHVATFARQVAAIRWLVASGARMDLQDADRYDAVTIAAVANDEEALGWLLRLGANARSVTSRYDGTALIAAAHLGHAGVVRQLLAAGAPANHVNNLGWTAVHESIVLGDGGPRHQDTLQALIGGGADLMQTDRQGQTPLQMARSRGYREMARMLEAAGAR